MGQPQYQVPGETDVKTLEPGSYVSSNGESVHHVACYAGVECIIYVRMEGKFDVIPAQPKKIARCFRTEMTPLEYVLFSPVPDPGM